MQRGFRVHKQGQVHKAFTIIQARVSCYIYIFRFAPGCNGLYLVLACLGLEHKVSLRIAGRDEADLHSIIKQITEKAGGEAGGHSHAAGARIKEDAVEDFLKEATLVLGRRAIEEIVH
ncbi:DHH family phosphoesterase [Candidatus Woesearchaeota archaeon]|nr:DHH family phosphoesterase [Candidatus Woesearchaeota archaeon]